MSVEKKERFRASRKNPCLNERGLGNAQVAEAEKIIWSSEYRFMADAWEL